MYQHPAFKIDDSELDNLLNECEHVNQALEDDSFVSGSLVGP